MDSIYLHVPFCSSICYYCAFSRIKMQKNIQKEWLQAVLKESKETLSRMNASSGFLSTLYFGGGTPTCLDCEDFDALCAPFLEKIGPETEFSVECNPEHSDERRCADLVKNKVNRVSLGVQSFQNELLAKIGRHHTRQDIVQAVSLLKRAGIENISIDLIFALPGQSLQDVLEDLETFFALDIDHLSIYSLQIEDNSIFGKQHLQPADEDLEAQMYEAIVKTMQEHGYEHYEISSFARNQKYSKHNLAYWQDKDYAGIGYGACGREAGSRYGHCASLKTYIEHPLETIIDESSKDDAPFEAIMMALRTSFGLDIQAWNKKYGLDFLYEYKDVLDKYLENGLVIQEEHLRADEAGMEILNTILVDFMLQNC
jgi:oxygen-independent coproporphyrinogen-3 oxidase